MLRTRWTRKLLLLMVYRWRRLTINLMFRLGPKDLEMNNRHQCLAYYHQKNQYRMKFFVVLKHYQDQTTYLHNILLKLLLNH